MGTKAITEEKVIDRRIVVTKRIQTVGGMVVEIRDLAQGPVNARLSGTGRITGIVIDSETRLVIETGIVTVTATDGGDSVYVHSQSRGGIAG